MANPTVAAQVNADVNTTTNTTSKGKRHPVSTKQPTGTPPTSQETVSDSMSLVRRYLNGKGLSTTATTVMEQSWRSGTRKQYATYLQKWRRYCGSRGIDPICPSVEDGINFLAELYESGIGYSAINTARSAVSSIVTLSNNTTFGAHPMVCRFLKGVFELKPSLPKYKNIWDVNTVLTYLSGLHPPQDLALKDLTYKTTMLLALLSGQRCQTLHLLSVSSMVLKHDTCVFPIHNLLKTSRPGKHVSELTFMAYSPDNRLCPFVCLSEYVKRTSELRKGSYQLLVSFQKPHKPVSTDTISRWLKTVLEKSGIDTSVFKGHSTRAASTSAAAMCKVPLSTIMDNAGWSNATTFGKFYKKPIVPASKAYGQLLLENLHT